MQKFSNNNINDFNILKNAIIGFEFEFFAEKSYFKLLEYLTETELKIPTLSHAFADKVTVDLKVTPWCI